MATAFPTLINNLEAQLTADYLVGSGTMTVRPADASVIAAAGISASRPFKFTAVAQAALDVSGNLINAAKTTIFTATGVDTGTNQLTGVAAASNEGTTAAVDQTFAPGDLIRCEITAGMLNEAYTAINALETSGIASTLFGSFGEYKPPVLADSVAALGSIYFGSDHPDTLGQPKLCRKSATGTVTAIG